ncbi:MAG: ParA family protein [Planctomycetes bacterium]|nr:ParA family protein [Planctomycetota bacterium]MBI3844084.1 ParA family protein [Planctomycetota bacterium]
MRRLAVINQKGGVGKTTTAVNLGAALANVGSRVLLIDADPQANLSVHLSVDIFHIKKSVYDVLRGEATIADVVVKTSNPNLDVVPSHIDLSGAELELASMMGRETVLREALRDVDARSLAREAPPIAPAPGAVTESATPEPPPAGAYDFVIVDCPPSLGLLSVNALTATAEVIVPVQTQFFALQGMSKLLDVLRLVRRRLNPTLRLLGLLPCLFDSRTNLSQEVLAELRAHFGERVFTTAIRANVKLAEAPSHGKHIFDYAPDSRGAEDYLALAREVLARGEQTIADTIPELRATSA